MPSNATNRAILYTVAGAAGLGALLVAAKSVSGAQPGDVATAVTLGTSPNPSNPGAVVTASGQLTRSDTGGGVPSAVVQIEASKDQLTWQALVLAPTDANGGYSGAFIPTSGVTYIRSKFLGAQLP